MPLKIKEVAKIIKVSVATVSRVLNNSPKVNPATREKVLKVIKEVDYHPNASGSRLRTKKTFSLGVVSQHFAAFYHRYMYHIFADIIRGVAEGTRQTRYDIMLARPALNWQENTEYLRLFKEGKVDGVMVIYPLTDDPNLGQIAEKAWPVVLIGASSANLDYVDVDNCQCVIELMEHLIGTGHTRIGIINGRKNETCYGERFAAYCTSLEKHGIAVLPELIGQGAIDDNDGYLLMQKMLVHRPTAVFASNDLFAAGAAKAIQEAGLRIPDDMALAGFTDTPQSLSVQPPLTTVRIPLIRMGMEAVKLLIKRIEGASQEQQKVIVPGQLIIRASTLKPKE